MQASIFSLIPVAEVVLKFWTILEVRPNVRKWAKMYKDTSPFGGIRKEALIKNPSPLNLKFPDCPASHSLI